MLTKTFLFNFYTHPRPLSHCLDTIHNTAEKIDIRMTDRSIGVFALIMECFLVVNQLQINNVNVRNCYMNE